MVKIATVLSVGNVMRAMVFSPVRGTCVFVCAYVCVWVCMFMFKMYLLSWMLKVKLIRSENTCWAQVIVCDKYGSFLSGTDLWHHSFFQSPADETKLKMMQEVSENFEVNAMNAHSGWVFAYFWSLLFHHYVSIKFVNFFSTFFIKNLIGWV